jgi:hypothetical protein
MKVAFAALLVIHGAIHAAGFLKAYRLAELPQLAHPVTHTTGLAWLGAGLGFVAASVLLLVGSRSWWAVAGLAVVASQALIIGNFAAAKLGTIVNAIVLVPVALALVDLRPSSLRSIYAADTASFERQAAGVAPPPVVTEADLAPLPPQVQTYLRRAGAVGRPRVRSVHAVFDAQMRMSPDAGWMQATVDQHNFYAAPAPARLFFMEASRSGIPFVGLHRYVGGAATMQVRVAGLVPVVDASGARMTQGETVTLFNDIVVLSPAALVGAPVTWQVLGSREVKATYTNAGHTIVAVLTFDQAGDLVGFVSEDRYQSDGQVYRQLPWSTPLRSYRDFNGVRVASEGDALWREPRGEWTYGKFVLKSITYNGGGE